MIAAGLFLISFIVLQFVKLNSCASYLESWLGFAPVYVVETAVAVGGAYFFMPKNPDLQDPILRVSGFTPVLRTITHIEACIHLFWFEGILSRVVHYGAVELLMWFMLVPSQYRCRQYHTPGRYALHVTNAA